jgi:hypothetical protein
MANKKALALPDALLVRYFRDGTIDEITKVTILETGVVQVLLRAKSRNRTERWRDLGGGIGFVPEVE